MSAKRKTSKTSKKERTTPQPGEFRQSEIVQKVVDCLAQWNVGEIVKTNEIDDGMANAAAMLLQQDPCELQGVVSSLKLDQLAEDGNFFRFISLASRRIGWGAGQHALLGSLWAGAYNSISEPAKNHLLEGIVDDNDFFTPLYCLPSFLSIAHVPASVLANWLPQIRARLGANGASAGLWNGLEILAQNQSLVALEVLMKWMGTRPNDGVISMAMQLLGRLRALDTHLTSGVDELLRDHQDENRRIVFHRSWIVYDQLAPLDASTYQSIIEQMACGTPLEMAEALNFIRGTLTQRHRCDESFMYGVRWLHQHAPSEAEPGWTHWVINLARECDQRIANLGLPLLQSIIPRLLPIKLENEGTWRELEELLITVLKSSRRDFESLLFSIAEMDRNGLVDHFSNDSGFHQLRDYLQQNETELLFYSALSSLKEPVRHLGMTLFSALHGCSLPADKMKMWSDDWVAVLILHLQQESFYDAVIIRFLLALLPRVEAGSDRLKNFFEGELIYQMKNLPGACLEPFQKSTTENNHDLIKSAVQKAQLYFDNIRPCHGSAINSIEVKGFRRATRLQRRRQSKQLVEGMEKGSALISLFSKSYTLYGGKQWQTYVDGRLDEPTSMNEYSHSMEIPRFITLDPDGCALRRRKSSRKMSELVELERRKREIENVHES